MPNILSRFLKKSDRGYVVRVIAVYSFSASVVLLLVKLITVPFGLPDWTFTFLVVILAVGLILALVLSCLYDSHTVGNPTKPDRSNM